MNGQLSENVGVLVITHYQRLLDYIKPDFVHVLLAGKLVRSGGPELALYLEEHGYDPLIQELREAGEYLPEDAAAQEAEERERSLVGAVDHDPFRAHGRKAL